MSKLEHAPLSEIMTRNVITLDISETVEEALRLMVKYDIGSIIVKDKEKPVGIITERDITRAALRGDSMLRIPARSLMSRPLQTVPVVEDEKLLGLVTEKDLTRWVLRFFYAPNIPAEIRSLVQNPKIEVLSSRPRCPSCGHYQDECICVSTELTSED
jgi:CBS domain-containing protein